MAQDRCLCLWSVETLKGPTIVRGRVARVGLGCSGAVSWCPGGAPYHHYSLARIGNSEVFFVSLSLLSFCFVIIIKYSRAQRGKNKHHTPITIPLCCSRAQRLSLSD